ncbi:helix-turn-helix domain-containing protein [Sphingomonadaceae bacterium jetA1]|jgi:AcrR family transcriptional regulator|uniref:TetR/AcrR family transcriptional regulator n=1 Tax=Facivitalis istanbulensis TaxID=3075838 RepID=UPI0034831780
MRKDAQVRRDRLIAAAADLFEQHGYGVALEGIAERAGVGRGTLYRNFADRNAIIVAVLETRLDELSSFVRDNAGSPTLFADFMRRQRVVTAFHAKALVGAESDLLDEVVASLRGRADALLGAVLAQAIAAGSVAASVTVADMRLVNRMLIAAATMPGFEENDALERALAIIMAGLRRQDDGD